MLMNTFLWILHFIVIINLDIQKFPEPTLNQNTLEITVTGVVNQNGTILLNLFNSEEGFPGEREKAYRSVEQKIKDKVNFIINNLPAGTYAASLIHDENNNRRFDTNFIGVPKEGYGASNNIKKMFRAPRFNEASFEINEDPKRIEIEMIYL